LLSIRAATPHRIVSELCDNGYLTRSRKGTRNQYKIRPDTQIHDPLLGDHSIEEILAVVAPTDGRGPRQKTARGGGPKRRR
jgi:hypothetical protein